MNMDETAEQCAKRELEEETGLRDVSVENFIHSLMLIVTHVSE